MSAHHSYKPSGYYYRQDRGGSGQSGTQGVSPVAQTQGGMPGAGMFPTYPFPVQQPGNQGQGSEQGYPYSGYPIGWYNAASSDMQYIMQMMINLGNQLDNLNKLIAQNNQLLQSIQGQEDTKCVQGTGGGAVIVRM